MSIEQKYWSEFPSLVTLTQVNFLDWNHSTSSQQIPNHKMPPPESSEYQPIDLDAEETNSSQLETTKPKSLKRSWVWTHLTESNDGTKIICQVKKKYGTPCGKKLKKDQSRSTKNYHDHLNNVHKLFNPTSSNKMTKQCTLDGFEKSGVMPLKVTLSFSSLVQSSSSVQHGLLIYHSTGQCKQ